ncbi:MAG: glycosyltransferase family 4 protein [Melioribacteraceae bacterium]|nr:glycosyltransferase family 4 protein [Melioribacteraceae bacterium]
MKLIIVTNIPTPYRNPVFELLYKYKGIIDLKVLFCSNSEPNRSWSINKISFDHTILSDNNNKFIHFNLNVIKELRLYNPDVIITSGFTPTMLLAWIWSIITRKKHIPFSDANINSEKNFSFLHKIIRKIVYKTSSAYIGASNKTFELFKSYGVDSNKLFKSVLAIDNSMFYTNKAENKKYDLLYCGQFNDRKNPQFFIDLSIKLNKQNPKIKVLLIGNGPLKDNCIKILKLNNVDFHDAGFVQPSEISKFYHASKLFIFPTKRDPWGLVANEALASGLPVLVTSVAGVANELVINGYNGYVFESFDLDNWQTKIIRLIKNKKLYTELAINARKSVSSYTHESAAYGIIDAVHFSLRRK